MPVMVHPELPDVRRTVSQSSFDEVWSKSGWVLEEEQSKATAEPKRKRKETS